RLRDDARIGGEDAVDVGPDLDLLRSEGRSEDRRGVVASAATERRDVLLLIAADIARDDGDLIGSRKGGADALVDVRERTRGAEAAVGDEPGVEGIPSASRKTDRGEVRRDDAA